MAIILAKGQKINLEKGSGEVLDRICVGLNWGAIDKKKLFGNKKVAVDLDGSCAIFGADNDLLDLVYYGNVQSRDRAVIHSGDDLTGDTGGNDNLDNEVISIDLSSLTPSAKQLAFILNSYKHQDFADIPFATIRIYEGTPEVVNSVFANFDVASDPKFSGFTSMIMGRFYKNDRQWKFAAIGEATKDRDLQSTVNTVIKSYL